MVENLTQGDLPGLIAAIKRLFHSIPWRNFTNNTLPEVEGYYASVLYAFLASLDAEIILEDLTNHGQVDLTVKVAGYIYVIEIKLVNGQPSASNPALAQILARGYSQKYRASPNQGLYRAGLGVLQRGAQSGTS